MHAKNNFHISCQHRNKSELFDEKKNKQITTAPGLTIESNWENCIYSFWLARMFGSSKEEEMF